MMRTSTNPWRLASAALALAVLLVCAPRALAQDAPQESAAAHFDRGIAFFNEGRHDAALAELARAYELAPAPQTLYNLARVHALLGHAVEASDAYARYLEGAGDAIDRARRREVERALEEQRARIGRLVVRSPVAGATVAVDGADVATTPLPEPLRLSAGAHIVEVRAASRETVRQAVMIAGQAEVVLDVDLREENVLRGTLRIGSSLPDVGVFVDGESVGLTPLSSTLPLRAGEHEVVARRLGYREERRRIDVPAGGEAEIDFDMRRDADSPPEARARIRLILPDAPYLLRVDGQSVIGVDLELPVGSHQIAIEVTDRQAYQGAVHLAGQETRELTPPLAWTLSARSERVGSAATRSLAGLVMAIGGGALTVASVGIVAWNEAAIATTDARVNQIQREIDAMCPRVIPRPPWTEECAALLAEGDGLSAGQNDQDFLRGISIAGTLLGAVITTVGLVLWATAPTEEAIDAQAHASLRLGPGGLLLDGAF